MSAFEFSQMEDFVAGQLLSYVRINQLVNNLRFLAEDICGNPFTNSECVRELWFDQVTDNISFAGDSEKRIGPGDMTNPGLKGMDFRIQSPNVIKGDRMAFTGANRLGAMGSSGQIITANAGYRCGWLMPRAGSLVGRSGGFLTATYTSTGTMRCDIYKNGAAWVQGTAMTISANNTVYTAQSRYVRAADVFAAGDILEPYFTKVSGTYAGWPWAMIDVVFNT